MSFSRWKLMAGVLSVSLGGLATVAGQCPKKDDAKGSKNPVEVAADSPAIPPAPMTKTTASGPAVPPPPPDVVPPSPMPKIPSPPPSTVPDIVIVPPASTAGQVGQLPALPAPQPIVPPAMQMSGKASGGYTQLVPAGATSTPQAPTSPGVEPIPSKVPEIAAPAIEPVPSKAPQTALPPAAPDTKVTPPFIKSPDVKIAPPAGLPGSYGTGSSPTPPAPVEPPQITPSAPTKGNPSSPTIPSQNADPLVSNTATKFRIVLRVGEGEPTFEVRSGDDLVLKVVCDKVDIKSPEKGTGLSSVKASGKVHFAGFGAEGTCDDLSFLAGTGEVSMSGNVKIHVKDKLGRIESELSTETVKYKIDASAISGSLRP